MFQQQTLCDLTPQIYKAISTFSLDKILNQRRAVNKGTSVHIKPVSVALAL